MKVISGNFSALRTLSFIGLSRIESPLSPLAASTTIVPSALPVAEPHRHPVDQLGVDTRRCDPGNGGEENVIDISWFKTSWPSADSIACWPRSLARSIHLSFIFANESSAR